MSLPKKRQQESEQHLRENIRTFSEITADLARKVDQCRNELTNTITISLSSLCSDESGINKRNLISRFDLIEHNLAPYWYDLFQRKDERKFTVVVIPNALSCQQKQDQGISNRRRDITLTTQMSSNKIKRLVALAGRWNGPISAAVRITSVEELQNLKTDLSEYLEELSNVAFHFYFEDASRLYPHNILRNVALDYVSSIFFALFDVDFLPSPINTHHHLQSTFRQNPQLENKLHNKTIFVMPAWEIDKVVHDDAIASSLPIYPETKDAAINREDVQIFHFKSFEPGHRSTNYSKWMSNLTNVSYPIVTSEFGYEPYIIGATESLPRFFPEFRGFGFNKFSFFTELHYANYQLEVLRDYFVFHVNHKTLGLNRKQQLMNSNSRCVKNFLGHLELNYGAGHLDERDEIVGWETWRDMGSPRTRQHRRTRSSQPRGHSQEMLQMKSTTEQVNSTGKEE